MPTKWAVSKNLTSRMTSTQKILTGHFRCEITSFSCHC